MQVVTAIYPDRDSAVAARSALGEEHYAFKWLAVTKPTDVLEHHGDETPEQHDLVEGSDGAVGAVGRFLSGAGHSLRKALEDHGVTSRDAEAIDLSTEPHGAVLVVHASDDGVAEVVRMLHAAGGRIFDGTGAIASDASPAPTTAVDPRSTVPLDEVAHVDSVLLPTEDDETVFTERRRGTSHSLPLI